MARNNRPIPEVLVPLQQQFEQFRATHPPRSKLPGAFWAVAAKLAKKQGLYPVAHALRLDYMGLKKRVGGSARRRRQPAQPRFVELIAPPVPKLDECVIEFESAQGRQGAHPVESCRALGLGGSAARLAAGGGMIRITAQMRVLVAIEPVDGRRGSILWRGCAVSFREPCVNQRQ